MHLYSLASKIKSVKVQGAREIAIESLKFLLRYAKKRGIDEKFFKIGNYLENLRPTAVVLHNCLEIVREKPKVKTIECLLKYLEKAPEKIGKVGKEVIKEGDTILTHCHSSEVIKVLEMAWKSGKRFEVIATRTEPLHQGLKTVKDLKKIGIPTTLIVDGAVSTVMEIVDKVIVGSDALRKEGVINKIGTKTIAIVAKFYKKKFYTVGDLLKIDKRPYFEIEKRDPKEIASIKNVRILNFAFDLTPWKFIDNVITDKGIISPKEIKKMGVMNEVC